jgi:hypothetical protein
MKQLNANTTSPTPTSSRASMRFINSGTSGITSSCGNPVHATTSPAC